MFMNKTLKDLLESPLIADIAPEAISKRDLTQEEFYTWTLQEIADRMGWRNLNRSFTRLFRAAEQGRYFFRLYDERECAAESAKGSASLVWLPASDPGADQRPYVLLVPGGGFVNVWNLTEGWPVAQHFNNLGYHVFVLTYQVCVEGAALRAMDDMARAMALIRNHRAEFRVDPDRYITCGFSAGGYIVCLWNTQVGYAAKELPRPQACFPIYPPTSYRLMNADEWDDEDDKDAFARDGVGCSMAEACNSCFEIPMHVQLFPPTAIFATAEDELVDPEHSRLLARALDAAGIPCRLEIGSTGGHGFADGVGMCMEGWPQRAIDWYEHLA